MGLGLFELFQNGNTPGLLLSQYPLGILRHTGGDGVGLLALEKQQILVRLGLVKGVVYIPFSCHPVKESRSVHGDAAGGLAVGHELPHRLPAVGRLVGAVGLADFAASRPDDIGQPTGGQFGRLHRNGYGAPGNIFVYQSNHPFLWDNLSRSVVIAPAPPFWAKGDLSPAQPDPLLPYRRPSVPGC